MHVLKFFLNISAEEQRQRFLERLEHPEKHWKFSQADIDERAYWDDYTQAYEEAIGATAAEHAPWYIVPADHKWFARLVVAAAVAEKLREMDPQFPTINSKQRKALASSSQRTEAISRWPLVCISARRLKPLMLGNFPNLPDSACKAQPQA